MLYFTFTSYHMCTLGAAQYNHSLPLLATGSCPAQTSRSATAVNLSVYRAPATLRVSVRSAHLSLILFSSVRSLAFFVFQPFRLPVVCSVCPLFSVSFSLCLPGRSSSPVSASLSVSLYKLLISPLAFFVSETFLFNWLCFSFGLSGFLWLCLAFPSCLSLSASQMPPFKPCYPSVPVCWTSTRTLQRRMLPVSLIPDRSTSLKH